MRNACYFLRLMTAQDVRELRKTLDVSQRKFAGLLGVSPRTIQGWEAGERIDGPADKLLRQFVLMMEPRKRK